MARAGAMTLDGNLSAHSIIARP